jgi:hypothetical protein
MTNMETANIILQQLGGGRFVVMTGAKHLMAIDGGLQFRVGKNACGVNLVRVILDVNDTYRMEFCRLRKCQVTILSVKTDVYCDQLQSIFTDQTGLYTSLGTMRRAA